VKGLVDQAKAAWEHASQLVEQAEKAVGEVAASAVHEVQEGAKQLGTQIATEYDAVKKDVEEKAKSAGDSIGALVDTAKKHVEDAIARATELAEHGKTAADKAYAWAKDEAQAAVARANEVFEQCKRAYEEAQKVFEDLKAQLGAKAEKAGAPILEQATRRSPRPASWARATSRRRRSRPRNPPRKPTAG